MTVQAIVLEAIKAGRKQMASEVLLLIKGMHGPDRDGRMEEYVRHEIDPIAYPPARIPMYCRQKITKFLAIFPTFAPPAVDPTEPINVEVEENAGGGDWLDEFDQDEAEMRAAAAELDQDKQPA